jgi:hypothetical protein
VNGPLRVGDSTAWVGEKFQTALRFLPREVRTNLLEFGPLGTSIFKKGILHKARPVERDTWGHPRRPPFSGKITSRKSERNSLIHLMFAVDVSYLGTGFGAVVGAVVQL